MGKKKSQTHTSFRDIRQITAIVSSSTNGSMLPLQVMFQGIISQMLPPMNEGRKSCLSSG
jgi:hypothetical protein